MVKMSQQVRTHTSTAKEDDQFAQTLNNDSGRKSEVIMLYDISGIKTGWAKVNKVWGDHRLKMKAGVLTQ